MITLQIAARRRTYAEAFFILVALWFSLLAIFHAWPMIDIRISALFFSSPLCMELSPGNSCGSFTIGAETWARTLRWTLYALPYVAAATILAALVLAGVSRRVRNYLPVRRLWLSLASLGVSAGLITSLLFKEQFGRPRPSQTDLFGGQMTFMPAGSFGGACERNCSFISGEASGAGWLIGLLLLLPPRYRTWIAPPVIIASVTTAALRVVVGAHYASDATLGVLVSVTVFAGMLALEEAIDERKGGIRIG
ncbi:phosphatase PAP2 family protein [Rhizobium metallidurans]|uniref:Membrane-associated phospholipid phosphatase n=1 Tax=Rhizobium metallidurans TaxID=1265931 RepID=A0A7W6GB79_9HYPH|nr:phosphatase PAP2 family protein [Rhizobium metallidurans]MBB3965378.1 membrane-associated phospholipid phosphatase [Rhizobium metallidurans]